MGIRINWIDNNYGEDGHRVYRSTSPIDLNNLPTPLTYVPAGTNYYDDGNVLSGTTYYYRVSAVFGLQEILSDEIIAKDFIDITFDENNVANTEADNISDFNVTLGNPSIVNGELVLPSDPSQLSEVYFENNVSFTGTGDYLFYFKLRCDQIASKYAYLEFYNGTTYVASIDFNYNWDSNVDQIGTVSVNVGASVQTAILETGVNTSIAREYAMHVDSDRGAISFYLRDGSGYTLLNSVTYFPEIRDTTRIRIAQGAGSSQVEVGLDYLSIAKPNFIALGDNITAGHTGFDPDPNFYVGVDNSKNSWEGHFNYLGLRNNFMVNKGVGGEDSSQVLARVTEATSHGARYVFLAAGNNDSGVVSNVQRTNNLQATINAISVSGARTVIVNAIYPNNNTDAAYYQSWWASDKESLADVYQYIDIMQPVLDFSTGYIDATKAELDGLHPNEAGYTLIGEYINSQFSHLTVAVTSSPLSAFQIKDLYESNADTNEFNDGEKLKLSLIEDGATADQTGAEIKAAYEAQPNTNAFDDAAQSKLAGIEDNAKADQTKADIDALGINATELGGSTKTEFILFSQFTKAIGNILSTLVSYTNQYELKRLVADAVATYKCDTKSSYRDRYGRVQYVESGIPRLEKEGLLTEGVSTNLTPYPRDHWESDWQKAGVTVFSNVSLGPDKSYSSDKIVPDTTNSTHYYYHEISVTAGEHYTLSVVVAAGGYDYVQITGSNGFPNTQYVNYSVASGTLGNRSLTTAASSIEPLADGYYLVTYTDIAASTTAAGRIIVSVLNLDTASRLPSFSGDGTGGLYIFQTQVEQLSFSSSLIPTADTFTSRASSGTYYDSAGVLKTAANDVARYSYNPADLTAPAFLLLENSATNLLPQSEDLSTYSGAGTATLDASIIDPFSRAGHVYYCSVSEKYKEFVGNGERFIGLSYYTKQRTASTYPFSNKFQIWSDTTAGSSITSVIDPIAKTSSVPQWKVIDAIPHPNDWYRVLVIVDANSLPVSTFSANSRLDIEAYQRDHYIFGLQVEKDYPTSYIPTAGTTITRAADISSGVQATRAATSLTIDKDNLTLASEAHTLTFEIKAKAIIGNQYLYAFDGDNRSAYINASGELVVTNGDSHTYTLTTPITTKSVISIGFDGTTERIYQDNLLIDSNTKTVATGTPIRMFVGSQNETAGQLEGWIKQHKGYDINLTDVEQRVA